MGAPIHNIEGEFQFNKNRYSKKPIYKKMAFILEYLAKHGTGGQREMCRAFYGEDIGDYSILTYALNQLLQSGEIEKCSDPRHPYNRYRRTVKGRTFIRV